VNLKRRLGITEGHQNRHISIRYMLPVTSC